MRTGCWAGVAAALFLSPALADPQSPLLTVPAASASATTTTSPNYRFAPARQDALTASAQLLSAEERQFLAGLPEIRVAVPLPPAEPYELIRADGLISGLHPDMLVALAQVFGLKLRPVVLPDWSRMLQAAQAHEVDLILSIGITPARLEYLAFTLGTTPLPGGLFTRQGAAIDPQQARYAVERDFVAQDWLHRQYPQAPLLVVADTAAALAAVGRGEAEAYLGSLLATTDLLARQPVAGVALNRIVSYGSGYYHFAVRKDWSPLVTILNKGIQNLRLTQTGMPALQASAPGAEQLPRLLSLSAAEAGELARRSVWRVGAVRGLTLLNEVNDRGTHSGIAAEYTEQLARRLGVGMEIVSFESVAAMIEGLRDQRIDVVPFLTRTRARESEFAFSAPYVEMPYTLVGRVDGPLYWGLDSLRGKSLALTDRHPLLDILSTAYPDIRIVQAPPGFGAMDLVLRGDADAAVEVKLFANLRIHEPGGEGLRVLGEVNDLQGQFHFAVRRGEGALLSLIDRGLADIAPSERQRMLRRWVAVDLQAPFPWRRYALLIGVVCAALLGFAVVTLLWMKRLQQEVRARRRSDQVLNDIAAQVPGAVFRYVVNTKGQLTNHYFTPGARTLLGLDLDPKATILDTLADHGDPTEVAEGRAAQARSLRTGEPFEFTGRYHHPDGHLRWLRVHAVGSKMEGDVRVWTGYMVDISSERGLQDRLAREAQSRNLMLASASHELRAPTHTLSLALQALPRDGLDDQQSRALRIAEDSASTLSALLTDLLDTARTGHDVLQLRPRSFDLHQLLEDVAGAWRSAAASKGLSFELRMAPDLPHTVVSDPLRLKQVLINLLSNACKYTATGRVALAADANAEGALRLAVSDTGIGISKAAQSRLFRPYVTLQDERAEPPPEGSTGLGLASSRRLAELLGGQLTLDSVPGQGTCVTLSLPQPRSEARGPRPGQVLVCDDDDVSRLLMCEMLRSTGVRVDETGSCEQALALWHGGRISALVTDLDLPGMGGMDLIRAIRDAEASDRAALPTRIIVCSGCAVPSASSEDRQPLYDAWLVKPVLLSTLTDTLHRLGIGPSG